MPSYPYGLKGIPGFKRIRSQKAPSNSAEFPTIKKGLGGLPKRRQAPPEWVLTVDITAGGQDWSVDINAGTGVDIRVDWDDGTVDYFTTTGEKKHVYSTPGRYFPRISGKFSASGNIRFSTNSGNRSRLKATGVVPYIPGLVSFQSTFGVCTGLTSIPADLFRYNTAVSTNSFYATFSSCTGLTTIPADLFRYNTAVSDNGFYNTFSGCTGITSIPADLFRYNTAVSDNGFYNTFSGCTGITSIPADIFRYNTAVSTNAFANTFYNCTGLTSIPADLFRYNTAASAYAFQQTFYNCTGLTSIPADLFRYNTAASAYAFQKTFYNCTGLTSIPADLFRYNTAASASAFAKTFYNCTGLTSIPADLFRYNTVSDSFYTTFSSCTGLTTIPADLFRYNTACTSFNGTFQGCNKLTLRSDIFCAAGEEGTRFNNQSVDFTNCMRISSFTGTQGTAPALWNFTFGSGTPTKTNCFTGHSTSSITNDGDIPAEWH